MVLMYFNVLDRIVEKSLEGVASLSTRDALTSPLIVGGMAIQLHCKDFHTTERIKLLRPTSDVDINYLERYNSYGDFSQSIGDNLAGKIRKEGYQTQLKKARNCYEVKVMNGQGNKAKELFFVHFDYVNPERQQLLHPLNEREHKNALNVNEEGKQPLYVVRIEDILPIKMNRVKKNLDIFSNPSPLHQSLYKQAERGDWNNLANIPLDDWCDELTARQNTFPEDMKKYPADYITNKDLYDICLLSQHIEGTPGSFNRAYYLLSKKEIDYLQQKKLNFNFS